MRVSGLCSLPTEITASKLPEQGAAARSGVKLWCMLNSYVDHAALGNSRHRLYILNGQCCICLLLSTMSQSANTQVTEPLYIHQWPPLLYSAALIGSVAAALGITNPIYNNMCICTHTFLKDFRLLKMKRRENCEKQKCQR